MQCCTCESKVNKEWGGGRKDKEEKERGRERKEGEGKGEEGKKKEEGEGKEKEGISSHRNIFSWFPKDLSTWRHKT